MTDREQIISNLKNSIKYHEHMKETFCKECIMSMNMAIAMLKEQEKQKFFVDESGKVTPLPVVVRCKDCKKIGYTNCHWFCKWLNRCVDEDWFCADGERRTDDA